MSVKSFCIWVVGFLLLATHGAVAADKIIFASTGSSAWDGSIVAFGIRKGFFQEAGLDVSYAMTNSPGTYLQTVISGSADIAVAQMPTFLSAAIQGAPVKMVASTFRGTSDFLWFVRSDSPLKSFHDLTEENTIGTTSINSTSYVLAQELLKQYHVKANIIAVGTSAASMTQVMTGQVDVGTDGNGLLGVPQYADGEIRPIAFGSEIEAMHGVTVRGMVVSDKTLANRRGAIARFLQAYQKTIDWMYNDPLAVQWFAEETGSTVAEAQRVRDQSYPEGILQVGPIQGIDFSVQQALQFKRIQRTPTEQELANMFDIVWSAAVK